MYSKKHSIKSLEKMSVNRKGKASGEDCYWFGKTLTKQHKKKLSDAKKDIYKGKLHPKWKQKTEIKCNICGAIMLLTKREIGLKTTCSRQCKDKCHSNLMIAEGNPMWKGGITFNPYPLGWNKTFKEQIRYRDRYKCMVCGMPEVENGRRLDVHHIDYDKNNLEHTNLISLCHSCHPKTNVHREYWKMELRNKVEDKDD